VSPKLGLGFLAGLAEQERPLAFGLLGVLLKAWYRATLQARELGLLAPAREPYRR
jgi:hypothetical protein